MKFEKIVKLNILPSVLILIFLIFISTNLISKDTNEFYDPARDSIALIPVRINR